MITTFSGNTIVPIGADEEMILSDCRFCGKQAVSVGPALNEFVRAIMEVQRLCHNECYARDLMVKRIRGEVPW